MESRKQKWEETNTFYELIYPDGEIEEIDSKPKICGYKVEYETTAFEIMAICLIAKEEGAVEVYKTEKNNMGIKLKREKIAEF